MIPHDSTYAYKDSEFWSMKDASVFKNTYCSCRGLVITLQLITCCIFSPRGSNTLV